MVPGSPKMTGSLTPHGDIVWSGWADAQTRHP